MIGIHTTCSNAMTNNMVICWRCCWYGCSTGASLASSIYHGAPWLLASSLVSSSCRQTLSSFYSSDAQRWTQNIQKQCTCTCMKWRPWYHTNDNKLHVHVLTSSPFISRCRMRTTPKPTRRLPAVLVRGTPLTRRTPPVDHNNRRARRPYSTNRWITGRDCRNGRRWPGQNGKKTS